MSPQRGQSKAAIKLDERGTYTSGKTATRKRRVEVDDELVHTYPSRLICM
jgi:hypothetical protein